MPRAAAYSVFVSCEHLGGFNYKIGTCVSLMPLMIWNIIININSVYTVCFMRLDESLSFFTVDLNFDDLPKEVIDRAKWCTMDYLGVAIAGSQTHSGKLFASLMKTMGGKRESTLIVDGTKVPSPNAAFANSASGHVLELDDGHYSSVTHPGTVIVPSALAIAEANQASGRELITSIVAGYETMIRIGKFVQPSHVYRGFHPTGTCGTLGAAATVAKLLKLTKSETNNALRIATLQSSGLLEVSRTGGSMKPLNPARAAQSGVYSALLAKRGARGPARAIDGEAGFIHAFSDNINKTASIRNIRDDFQIRSVYFKFYAACRNIHPAIEAALDLARSQKIESSEIKAIVVTTQSYTAKSFSRLEISDPASAKFSIPYSIAAALFLGSGWTEAFSAAKLRNRNILALARKVKIGTSSSFDKKHPYPSVRACKVRIETTKGGKFEKTVEQVKGDPNNVARNDLELKFKQLASGIIPRERVNEIISRIGVLEKLKDTAVLVNLAAHAQKCER